MSSKNTILKAVHASSAKRVPIEHPEIPSFEIKNNNLLDTFKKNLAIAGAEWYEVSDVTEAKTIMAKKLPDAKIICSATKEWQGNKDLTKIHLPRELDDVDLGVIRAEFGVAEMGMVWLTDESLKINSLGFLSQHLAILLDPESITENMHTAYKKIDLNKHPYGNFMMGPSATADIGATLVHGAQGARTVTIFFLKR